MTTTSFAGRALAALALLLGASSMAACMEASNCTGPRTSYHGACVRKSNVTFVNCLKDNDFSPRKSDRGKTLAEEADANIAAAKGASGLKDMLDKHYADLNDADVRTAISECYFKVHQGEGANPEGAPAEGAVPNP